MKASTFGIKRSKFKVTLLSNVLENALLALLTRYLENYWTEFQQCFIVDALWGKDECNFWGHKIEAQGHCGLQYAGKCTFWLY